MKISILLLSSSVLLSRSNGDPLTIKEDFVTPGFVPVENVAHNVLLGLCESDCDTDNDCAGELLCANDHKDELQAVGLDPRKANCYSVKKPIYWEVCFDPSILRSGDGGGDPHFRMYDDTMYSFHGQCDLVIATSPSFDDGNGLDLHIRTEMMYDKWSLISLAALRVGDDILEIVNDQTHYFNGIKNVELPIMMAGNYKVSVRTKDVITKHKTTGEEVVEQQLTYSVDLNHKNAMKFRVFHNFISVNVAKYLHDTHGLLGYRQKNGMIGRDGITVMNDPNEFGSEWQVRDFEPMLFQERNGPQYPEPCRLPVPIKDQKTRHLRQSSVSIEDATTACQVVDRHIKQFCIDDVIRTGDIHMAHGYMDEA